MRMRNSVKSLTLIGLCLLTVFSLGACSSSADQVDERGWPRKITIAYLPTEETDIIVESRTSLQADMSAFLGIEVEEVHVSDYNAVIEAMRTGRADVASFGPFSFVLATERANVVPVAMSALNGDRNEATYQSLLITNAANTDINSIADIKGRTIAFVDPNSTSGNLVPSGEIILAYPELNLTMDDLHTNGTFFEAVSFSGTHPASASAVEKNDIDLAPVASSTYNRLIAQGEIDAAKIKVVHTSPDIPNSPMAVRGSLPDDLIEAIQQFLITYDNEDFFEGNSGNPNYRYIPCSMADYEPVMELARIIEG